MYQATYSFSFETVGLFGVFLPLASRELPECARLLSFLLADHPLRDRQQLSCSSFQTTSPNPFLYPSSTKHRAQKASQGEGDISPSLRLQQHQNTYSSEIRPVCSDQS